MKTTREPVDKSSSVGLCMYSMHQFFEQATSGHSNLTLGRIAAANKRFSRI